VSGIPYSVPRQSYPSGPHALTVYIRRHDAERKAQEAVGLLERQKLKDQIEAEKARRALLELQAESSAVQSMGSAKAEARARAEAAQIEMQAELEQVGDC